MEGEQRARDEDNREGISIYKTEQNEEKCIKHALSSPRHIEIRREETYLNS